MKKALLLFSFLPLFAAAQDVDLQLPANASPVHKHEIGINLFSLTHLEEVYMYNWAGGIDINPPTGFYYKRHFGQHALRSSVDYSYHKVLIMNEWIDDMAAGELSLTKETVGLSVGYERSFCTGKLHPFFFADAMMNYEHQHGKDFFYGCFGPIGPQRIDQEVFEYGLSTGAGLRYEITPRFCASYEFAAQGYVSYVHDLENLYHLSDNVYREFGHHLNPVNKLGLAFSF